jgi:3'(2'), 5'-bisphosphate nucleotidase
MQPAVPSLSLRLPGLLTSLELLARAAGDQVMAVYATAFAVQGKADASPVTLADQQAEAVILAGLRSLAPDWPVVAEEDVAAGHVPVLVDGAPFWLVDPLDGTREFVARNGEFTVNIALIDRGRPVLGVVLAPALGGPGGTLHAGIVGQGAWVETAAGRVAIQCRALPPEGLTALASRSHGDTAAQDAFVAAYLARHLPGQAVANTITAGSSLKFCRIAEGEADIYPRLGRTMEWDIAAGHAVLMAAGGHVERVDAAGPLLYGKPGFESPHFVATGW